MPPVRHQNQQTHTQTLRAVFKLRALLQYVPHPRRRPLSSYVHMRHIRTNSTPLCIVCYMTQRVFGFDECACTLCSSEFVAADSERKSKRVFVFMLPLLLLLPVIVSHRVARALKMWAVRIALRHFPRQKSHDDAPEREINNHAYGMRLAATEPLPSDANAFRTMCCVACNVCCVVTLLCVRVSGWHFHLHVARKIC